MADIPTSVVKNGTQSEDDPLEFVLSDESVDRMGDIIRADGWSLSDFRKNPVALLGHSHDQIIGVWENVRVEGKRLMGRLKLAAPGTSELIDTVRSLIDQRILKAVSVGFQAEEASPRKDGGYDFTKSILHEVSVVAVPANANALRKAMQVMNPELAKLLVESDTGNGAPDGQSTLVTPKLDLARARAKSLGIDC